MAGLAVRSRAVHVPWTLAEERAYLALAAHCQGTRTEPACTVCRTAEREECETGARLRQTLQRATTSRTRQGVGQ
ncbi:hypothetical protein [Streptomyces sp. NPDC002644]